MTLPTPRITRPDHPELLALTQALSRHAKSPHLRHGDRRVLYEIKTEAIALLCGRGELRALDTSPGPWTFGEEAARAFPALRPLAGRAHLEQRALQIRDLRQLGFHPAALPFAPPATGGWADLSPSQRRQLHPQGSWLVGFARPNEQWPILHQPYLSTTWLLPPPPGPPRLPQGSYGSPPEESQPPDWKLPALLHALGVHRSHFPHRLRQR